MVGVDFLLKIENCSAGQYSSTQDSHLFFIRNFHFPLPQPP